jgi:hypothetical protein
VPETLTYQLASQICIIREINIQPFQGDIWNLHKLCVRLIYFTFLCVFADIVFVNCPAHFQMGSPIYSAKSVRFKMGHLKASLNDLADEMFVWTYTSPEFPMVQVCNFLCLSLFLYLFFIE